MTVSIEAHCGLEAPRAMGYSFARERARSVRAAVVAPGAVWKSTGGMDASSETSNLSISAKSKSIRLIFGRIDRSRRVLEAKRKSMVRTVRLRAR